MSIAPWPGSSKAAVNDSRMKVPAAGIAVRDQPGRRSTATATIATNAGSAACGATP